MTRSEPVNLFARRYMLPFSKNIVSKREINFWPKSQTNGKENLCSGSSSFIIIQGQIKLLQCVFGGGGIKNSWGPLQKTGADSHCLHATTNMLKFIVSLQTTMDNKYKKSRYVFQINKIYYIKIMFLAI